MAKVEENYISISHWGMFLKASNEEKIVAGLKSQFIGGNPYTKMDYKDLMTYNQIVRILV